MPAGREVGVAIVPHQILHGGLHLGVDGGLDRKAARVQQLLRFGLRNVLLGHDVLHQLAEQGIGKVRGSHGGVLLACVLFRQHQRLGGGVAVVLLADHTLLPHIVHEEVAAVDQILGVGIGVVVGRILGDGCNGSALPQGQLADILVEVFVRRRLHALNGTGEADGVQVRFQDRLLGVTAAQAERTVDLAQFAQSTLDAAGAVIIGQVFDELLLQCGCTLLGAVDGQQILVDHGADRALEVDARLIVKILVLGADERILQVGRDLLQIRPHAVAVGRAQGRVLHLCPGVRVGGHDHAGLAQFNVVQIQQVAVVGGRLHHIQHSAHRHQATQHDAQAHHRCDRPAKEPQDRVPALLLRFLWLLRRLCRRFSAAVVHVYFSSRRLRGRCYPVVPMDLLHFILGNGDRLLTQFNSIQRAAALSVSQK